MMPPSAAGKSQCRRLLRQRRIEDLNVLPNNVSAQRDVQQKIPHT
jgi:hypothetical protein